MAWSFKVRHGHCSRCHAPASLFVVDLIGIEPPKLRPKPDNVHYGTCLDCIRYDSIGTILAVEEWRRAAALSSQQPPEAPITSVPYGINR